MYDFAKSDVAADPANVSIIASFATAGLSAKRANKVRYRFARD
jgi:hypothetical protein